MLMTMMCGREFFLKLLHACALRLHSAPAPAAGEAGYPRVHEDGYFLTNYSVRMSTCEICTDSLN